jgi:pimeloyl-ACP methyl ester carboxylesterase
VDIRVNDLRFHVDDAGNGPSVILLHGWPNTSRVWRRQVEALVRSGFRAVTPDLRGRGRSDKPQDVAQYRMPLLVSDVVGILDALDIERAHVVGHDWGSAVAWFVASLHPSRVDHLVDICFGNPAAAPRLTLQSLQRASHRIPFQFPGVAESLLPQDDWYLLRALANGRGDMDEAVKALSEPGALTAGFSWYRANAPLERLVAPPPRRIARDQAHDAVRLGAVAPLAYRLAIQAEALRRGLEPMPRHVLEDSEPGLDFPSILPADLGLAHRPSPLVGYWGIPPRQVSPSKGNTSVSGAVEAVGSDPGRPETTTRPRHRARGANTPWQMSRFVSGRGVSAARRSRNSSGSKISSLVPSFQALLSSSAMRPSPRRRSRSCAKGGRKT